MSAGCQTPGEIADQPVYVSGGVRWVGKGPAGRGERRAAHSSTAFPKKRSGTSALRDDERRSKKQRAPAQTKRGNAAQRIEALHAATVKHNNSREDSYQGSTSVYSDYHH